MKERRSLLRLQQLVAPGCLLPGFLWLWLPISGAGVAVVLLALAGSGPSACAATAVAGWVSEARKQASDGMPYASLLAGALERVSGGPQGRTIEGSSHATSPGQELPSEVLQTPGTEMDDSRARGII